MSGDDMQNIKEPNPYYVSDLLPQWPDKALTISGAWSFRHTDKYDGAWAAIKKNTDTYTRAVRHMIFNSNDEKVLPRICKILLEHGD